MYFKDSIDKYMELYLVHRVDTKFRDTKFRTKNLFRISVYFAKFRDRLSKNYAK
jgi:hypothetical protein